MQESNLVMNFKDSVDGDYKIRLKDPKADLSPLEVRSAMQTIIDDSIFESKGNDLKEIKSAVVVTTNRKELI